MRVPLFAAIAAALAGCTGATGPEREISGKVVYQQYCARCHGQDGRPIVPGAPNLADPNQMAGVSDMGIKGIVRQGAEPRRDPQTGEVVSQGMPGFGDQFTDAALMVLVAYLRGLSGSESAHARPEGEAPGPTPTPGG
jgi:mono/diheme cytochrome c family protein